MLVDSVWLVDSNARLILSLPIENFEVNMLEVV